MKSLGETLSLDDIKIIERADIDQIRDSLSRKPIVLRSFDTFVRSLLELKYGIIVSGREPAWDTLEKLTILFSDLVVPTSISLLVQEPDDDNVIVIPPRVVYAKRSLYAFSVGSTRSVYKSILIDDGRDKNINKVQKYLLKREILPENERVDHEAYLARVRTANYLATQFTLAVSDRFDFPAVKFVTAGVGQIVNQRGKPFCLVEDEIPTNHWRDVSRSTDFAAFDAAIVDAYCHWTYLVTDRQIVVVACKGRFCAEEGRRGSFIMTNPTVYSTNMSRFQPGNKGQCGIDRFFVTHICNQYCTQPAQA